MKMNTIDEAESCSVRTIKPMWPIFLLLGTVLVAGGCADDYGAHPGYGPGYYAGYPGYGPRPGYVSAEIGDRPYYTRGPGYYVGRAYYVWRPGHWVWRHGRKIWIHGHYVIRG